MSRNLTDDQIFEIADHLNGTCGHDPEIVAEEMFGILEFTIADCVLFDEQIFRCDDCGWWCGVEEMVSDPETLGEQYCDGCRSDEET